MPGNNTYGITGPMSAGNPRAMTDEEIKVWQQEQMAHYYRWLNNPEAQRRDQEARMNASSLRTPSNHFAGRREYG